LFCRFCSRVRQLDHAVPWAVKTFILFSFLARFFRRLVRTRRRRRKALINQDLTRQNNSWRGSEQEGFFNNCQNDLKRERERGALDFLILILFVCSTVESGASDVAAQAVYAREGTCQCLNVEDCPRTVKGCLCPQDKGLHKVCTACGVGVCKIFEPEPKFVPPTPPCGPGDVWRRDGYCAEGDPECPRGADDEDWYSSSLRDSFLFLNCFLFSF
jgi:hypothetical protein